MSGRVSVYLRDDSKFYVSSYSQIINGPQVVNGWVYGLSVDESTEHLGRAVIEGMNRTQLDVHEISQEELARLLRPLLKLAGVKSYTRFADGTKAVKVSRDVAEHVTISPTQNRGRKGGGFIEIPGHAVDISPPYDEQTIGRAVKDAFAKSLS